MEIPAVTSPANAYAVVYAIGFRNRLLAIPLSVLAEPCQVLFLFYNLFFDARSLRPQIMIAWRAETLKESAFQRCPLPGHDRSRWVTSEAETIFVEENAWATQ